jgi:hypothetical protein
MKYLRVKYLKKKILKIKLKKQMETNKSQLNNKIKKIKK